MTVLLDEVETLYESVVLQPDQWTEQSMADWAEGVATTVEVDKASAKYLRRIVRMAVKLQQFWESDNRRNDVAIDWQSRVDLALGPRAWRPVLDLATHLLEVEPTPDLFDRVGALFRVVNAAPWMEGTSYDEWLAQNQRK